jgi:pimeloyl-ACP methyl ester carboxylesterase
MPGLGTLLLDLLTRQEESVDIHTREFRFDIDRLARAAVSRGGRPDLAGAALPKVTAPTLLIVGGHDEPVIDLNEDAKAQMQAAHVELRGVGYVPSLLHPATPERTCHAREERCPRRPESRRTCSSINGSYARSRSPPPFRNCW